MTLKFDPFFSRPHQPRPRREQAGVGFCIEVGEKLAISVVNLVATSTALDCPRPLCCFCHLDSTFLKNGAPCWFAANCFCSSVSRGRGSMYLSTLQRCCGSKIDGCAFGLTSLQRGHPTPYIARMALLKDRQSLKVSPTSPVIPAPGV